MRNKKYTISSVVMFLTLFFVAGYQAIRVSNLTVLNNAPVTTDIAFIITSILMTVLISFCMYYLPLLLVITIQFKLDYHIMTMEYPLFNEQNFVQVPHIISRRYLRLNVIRC